MLLLKQSQIVNFKKYTESCKFTRRGFFVKMHGHVYTEMISLLMDND